MREIRTSGSEGGGTGNSTGPSYPYHILKNRCSQTLDKSTVGYWNLGWSVACNELVPTNTRSYNGGIQGYVTFPQ